MAEGALGLMDNLVQVVISAGTLVLAVVLIIILLAKTKEVDTVAGINESGINASIDTGIAAIQTPIDFIELIVVFLVLIGLIILFIVGLKGMKKGTSGGGF